MRPNQVLRVLGLAVCMPVLLPAITDAQVPAPLRARIVTTIGEGAAREHTFGRVTGLAIDTSGLLYVSDGQDNQVVVFDANGLRVTSIGRKGNGPGEFQYPTSLAIAGDGALWVRDQQRVQRFVRDGRGAAASRFASVVGSVPMADWMSQRTGVIDADGRFLVPNSHVRTNTTPPTHVQMMQRLDASGAVTDSLMVPSYPGQPAAYAGFRTGPHGGRMLPGLNHVPFAPVAAWSATPRGTIVSGDPRTYMIVETDRAGRVIRRYSRTAAPVAIPAAERRDSARALARRIDSIPVPVAQVDGMPDDVKARRLPSHYPLFRELLVSTDGMLWVRRWPASARRGISHFDVFSPDARFVGTAEIAAELAPSPSVVVNGAHAAGVVVDPETGLEQIVRFEVPAPLRGTTRGARAPAR